jgi:hypothetical protein
MIITIILILILGLLIGFAAGSPNTRGSAKIAIETGAYLGAILGYALFLGGNGWIASCCIFGSVVAGSFMAAITPNNVIKSFYNRAIYRRQ